MTMNNLTTAALSPKLSPNDNLTTYFRAVYAEPLLSAELEYELAMRYQRDGDLEAARTLVLSHLRYVAKVARGFMGYGLPLPDLIQEGSVGLMKAVKRFDPQREVRLVSFAMHWIRAEIYEYIIRNWRTVKIATTKAQRKLFFNLRKSKTRLGWLNNAEVEQLATQLEVDAKTVRAMEARMSQPEIAYDPVVEQDDDEVNLAPSQFLGDSRYDPIVVLSHNQQEAEQQQQLTVALAQLDARSRDIVTRRWLGEAKPTLHTLAAEYGVSAERIRQIEQRAMQKMKHAIGAEGAINGEMPAR